jgi:2-oxoglutarate ferredoxin oxidoreductase subunit beta
MVTIDDYGDYETAWCPGCGNFSILNAVKQALVDNNLKPHEVLFVSGIGQAAKAPHYLNVNLFNGLHGRSLPVATGAKLANPKLTVIVESGDGCCYGEGGNHFLAAIRRNVDITVLVHNNQVYGVTKAQPQGVLSAPFNPIAVAVAMKAGFVARGFAGMIDNLSALIRQGISHNGFSLIDVLQPCVSFNKVNTFAWYKQRCTALSSTYDPTQWEEAMKVASEWGERIPLGIIYRNDRTSFEDHFPVLSQGSLIEKEVDQGMLREIMEDYR